MRFRTLEIRWHDSKPISTCDFQPIQFKKARPAHERDFPGQSYRLASGGEDNHVRVWMVHPNIMPPSLSESASMAGVSVPAPRPPRVEYLATLSRHSAAVNVVRFSPNGELIASAGDDGMIIIWAPSNSPHASAYGSDLTQEELQYEKEHWKPRTTFRCTTMQVYDLAWSPSGEYIIAGSTDNAARVFAASDGKCVLEIAEHSHYVQGVAWDPLNEYIATQSSDRSMHIYQISTKHGNFEAHAVGKNMRMPHYHSRTPSTQSAGGRPRPLRADSAVSDAESTLSEHVSKDKDEGFFSSSASASGSQGGGGSNTHITNALLTPAASIASTPSTSMFPPPPIDNPSSSRRSSFSGSNAPSSPSQYGRYGRSPSPMPALPAIRTHSSAAAAAAWAKLYGDESFTNFFRRLTFSPDGGLLLTPAGQFEDPSVIPGTTRSNTNAKAEDSVPSRGRKKRPSINTSDVANASSASSVYIYSRANFARPPIAQLPGHKKASVAVRFSPVLYELRQGTSSDTSETKTAVLEKGKEGLMNVDLLGPVSGVPHDILGSTSLLSPRRTPSSTPSHLSIAAPTPLVAGSTGSHGHLLTAQSPALSPTDSLRPPTPVASKPSTPVSQPTSISTTASVFALPYRMLFAVVTMDTVTIYDTQQSSPVCMLTKLHYDEFTDMTWSPDGQCLVLSSRDGYCTIVIFDEILPAHHTQQHSLQLQSIAQHHSVPITYSTSNSTSAPSTAVTPTATPSTTHVNLPHLVTPSTTSKKRPARPLTPAASVDDNALSASLPGPSGSSSSSSTGESQAVKDGENKDSESSQVPPKKKRRVALTRVGDLD